MSDSAPFSSIALPAAGAKTADVVALGEASLDFVAVLEGPVAADAKAKIREFQMLPGGQAATVAVGCARQGWRARYIGVLGQDGWGDRVLSALAAESVEAVVSRRVGVPSRTAVVLVDAASGARSVLEHRPPELRFGSDEPDWGLVTSARILMVDTTDPAAAAQAARAARNAGVPTVVDADAATAETEPLMREIDVAIVARSFLDQMFPGQSAGEGLRRLVEAHRPAVAVVTLGAEGSLARSEEGEIFTPALPVEVRDTTGAGDAFRAGFVSAWLAAPDRPDLAWILKWATTTAGLSCQALGAQTGLPTRGEVERRL